MAVPSYGRPPTYEAALRAAVGVTNPNTVIVRTQTEPNDRDTVLMTTTIHTVIGRREFTAMLDGHPQPRVYISGPMTGIEDFNYPAFNEAAALLRARGYTPLNPADNESHNPTSTPQPWAWYMRHALRQLVDAHAVATLPGWENSRGAVMEVETAERLGIPVAPLTDWLHPTAPMMPLIV